MGRSYFSVGLLVLLSTVVLMGAQETQKAEHTIKVKAKRSENGVVSAKVLVTHEMDLAMDAKHKGREQRYLTSIIIKEGEETVLRVETTPYVSQNPFLKFVYVTNGSEYLSVVAHNRSGDIFKGEGLIKAGGHDKSKFSVWHSLKLKTEKKTNHPKIKETLGNVTLIETDEISLIVPEVASSEMTVPVNIASHLKAKRLILFATERDGVKRVAEWIFSDKSVVRLSIKIKLAASHPDNIISAVIEGEDGRYYIAEVKTFVALAGRNMGG